MDLEVSTILERLTVFSNQEISLAHVLSFFGIHLKECPDHQRVLGGILADHLEDTFSIYQLVTFEEVAEAFFDLLEN